ncbi:MAG TPA: c-type cytochrome domain-containing protein [Bryobacteraceae bacterium]|jgi:hypothetical protein
MTVALAWWMLLLAAAPAAHKAANPDFDRDILPIFEDYCLGCHATGIRMGSFECDTYEGVMRGATFGAVVVPGKSAESRLYMALTGKITPAMPMSNRSLTKSELEIIRRWIDLGAKPPAKKE